MFPHVRDVEGRKVRVELNVGELGLTTARRAKVTYHMYLASGGQLSYTKLNNMWHAVNYNAVCHLPITSCSREETFYVLQATKNWAGAWEQG